MKRSVNILRQRLTPFVGLGLFACGVSSCHEQSPGQSSIETCSLEAAPNQPTAEQLLSDTFSSDPPRGPKLPWFVLRQPTGLQSFRYPYLTYGALGAGDINGDGKIDLLAIGGSKFGVFLNQGGFEFVDDTEPSGLSGLSGSTLALGDLDNDGDLDLVISKRVTLSIYSNDGTGRFTLSSEISAPEVAANQLLLVDLDNDGLLDIFGSYPPGLSAYDRSGQNHVFHNQGQLSFVDVTEALAVPNDGNSWTSGACDLDGDGDQDIVVANDGNVIDFGDRSEATNDVQFPYNDVLINQGGQKLEDHASDLGLQGPYSSMGVEFEDVDRDGEFEIFITDYGANKLMKRSATGVYENISKQLGLDPAQRINDLCSATIQTPGCLLVSWGAAFRDFDLDGEDEVLVLNHESDSGMGQPLQLFKKAGDSYQEQSLSIPNIPAHALVTADFDGDGDLDFAVSTVGDQVFVFENVVGDRCGGNWLGVKLEGTTSNRQGIGATVTLEQDDGQTQKRLITSGGMTHGSPLTETHFGLGEHTAKTVTVHWPSGKISTLNNVPERTQVLITE